MPFVLAVLARRGVLASPVQAGIGRQIETRADVDALAATGDPRALAAIQRILALRSLQDPTHRHGHRGGGGASDGVGAGGAGHP